VDIIAGMGGTDAWKTSVESISATNTCYVISINGLNGSKNPTLPDFENIQKEILSCLQVEKVEKPVIIGHSFGGFIAMQLVVNHPDFFRKLILIDSYPFEISIFNPAISPEMGIQQAAIVKKQFTDLPEPTYTAFWTQNVQQFTADTLFQKLILQKIIESDKNYIAEAQSYVLSHDLRAGLKNIQCSVIALCSSFAYRQAGLNEDVVKERIEEQFSNIKDCNIFIRDDTRHFKMLNSKDWYLEIIRKNI